MQGEALKSSPIILRAFTISFFPHKVKSARGAEHFRPGPLSGADYKHNRSPNYVFISVARFAIAGNWIN